MEKMASWQLSRCVEGVRPLAVLSDGLVVHTYGALYKTDFDLQPLKLLCRLPIKRFVDKLAIHSRLVDRIARSSVSHALVFDNALFIARKSEIWRCDLNNGYLSLDFQIPNNRRSLGFTILCDADGSEELVFGEYFDNPKRYPVRIWGRASGSAAWIQRVEFGAGEIEHVHNISFADGQVFVLTGDFDNAAGIWTTDTEFSFLRPVARGRQAFRAAWMHMVGDRVFMATDTQLESNYLYDFWMNGRVDPTLQPLAGLGGSSIYSGRSGEEIVFSTCVEPGNSTGNFLIDLLDVRPGPGIRSSKASVMTVDGLGRVSEVYSAEKDEWPFRLAQFGTFVFPSGIMPVDTVYAFGIALRGVDGCCLVFRRSKNIVG